MSPLKLKGVIDRLYSEHISLFFVCYMSMQFDSCLQFQGIVLAYDQMSQ